MLYRYIWWLHNTAVTFSPYFLPSQEPITVTYRYRYMYNLSSASVLCVIYFGWWFHFTDMHTLSALTVIRDGYVEPLHMAVTVSSSREPYVKI